MTQDSKDIRISIPGSQVPMILAVAAVGSALFFFGIRHATTSRAMETAGAQLGAGLAALASETLSTETQAVIQRKGGCELLLAAHRRALQAGRLELAAQGCIFAGRGTP